MRWTLAMSLGLAIACGPDPDPAAAGDASSTGSTAASSTSDTGGPSVETKPWDVETETNPPVDTASDDQSGGGTTGAATTTGVGADGDGSTDEGEDGKVEEDFVGMFAYGPVEPGVSYTPEGEAIAFLDGIDECVVLWTATAAPDDTCAACDFAFTLTIDSTEIEEDLDCAAYGFDPATLEGSTFGIGLADRQLYIDDGEGWIADDGFGELTEDGEFEWEREIEP